MKRNQTFKAVMIILLLTFLGLTQITSCEAKIWKFALISDTHDSDKLHTPTGVTPALSPILAFIVSQNPDFVIETGDLITGTLTKKSSPVYKQYAKQYAAYLDNVSVLADNNIPLYTIRGNHDYGADKCDEDCKTAYMSMIAAIMPQTGPSAEAGLTYSFIHNDVKFILADQYVNAVGKKPTLNLDWIKAEIESGKKEKYVFVFGHSPMYAPNISDTKEHWNMYQQVALRDELWKTLTDAGNVVAYISGHKHLFCRGLVDGVHQLTIGDLGTLEAFDPGKADKEINALFPKTAVTKTDNHPGCMIITIDDQKNTITAAEYWLYGKQLQLHDEYRLR